MNYIPEFTVITSKFKPNNRGGFDIEKKDFNQMEMLLRSGKIFENISGEYNDYGGKREIVERCYNLARSLVERPYKIDHENQEAIEGEVTETFSTKMSVGYSRMENYGEIVDSRQERVYLKKTDETGKKKKEYLVPLDDHIEFEVTVSIKAKVA